MFARKAGKLVPRTGRRTFTMDTPVPASLPCFDDWDRPFTDLELLEIEAAIQSAAAKHRSSDKSSDAENVANGDETVTRTRCRRLPDSLFSNPFSLSPCRRSVFKRRSKMLPELAFRGRVVYCRTEAEAEKSADELLNFIETKRKAQGEVSLGLDLEWKPSFRRGVAPGKAAVLQICGEMNQCYVFHICHSGIPQNLQTLLQSTTTVKVGSNIANDARKIFLDHNVSIRNLEDLSALANQKLDGAPKNWGLASLTESLLCKQLPKPSNLRLGNWDTPVLSKEHLSYAATDAFVSWHLYQVLKSLPDAPMPKHMDRE
ncbi:unnamed protein product [Cuscuta campestris]|uniref:3'-5' exonuclease n=1 Tax=Cuscuta campestris TaxID=132261 RepID=A0A484LHK5_9ASTE|nr:unnamed protein product [Cuscuta campestris]